MYSRHITCWCRTLFCDTTLSWSQHQNGVTLNSVQKLCGTGFSQFLLLYIILCPTLLWKSYLCRLPLISPAGSVRVRASGKALISWEKSWNWKIRQQTKTLLKLPPWTYKKMTIFSLLHLGVVISIGEKFVGNYKAWLHTVYLEN